MENKDLENDQKPLVWGVDIGLSADDVRRMHSPETTGYTAADMATAAAQGFRDGVASVVVDLPLLCLDGVDAAEFYQEVIEAIVAAGGKVAE